MTTREILYCIYLVFAILVAIVPSIIGFIKAAKNKKKAVTAEEKAVAEKLMREQAIKFIQDAEKFYKAFDTVLKQTGNGTAGVYKKDSVMSKLQAFANAADITFDADYWSKEVDNLVAMTKEVN